jgi:hypothetical protein
MLPSVKQNALRMATKPRAGRRRNQTEVKESTFTVASAVLVGSSPVGPSFPLNNLLAF